MIPHLELAVLRLQWAIAGLTRGYAKVAQQATQQSKPKSFVKASASKKGGKRSEEDLNTREAAYLAMLKKPEQPLDLKETAEQQRGAALRAEQYEERRLEQTKAWLRDASACPVLLLLLNAQACVLTCTCPV